MKTHKCDFKVFVKHGKTCSKCKYAVFNEYKCLKCSRTSKVEHVCRGKK